jgi:hypothetical protein
MMTQGTDMSLEYNSYNTPKDFFIYFLSVITLYFFFTSLVLLLFHFINQIFPYKAYNEVRNIQAIRWYVATIIVTLPVYIYTLISLRKDYLRYPEKRNLKVRKWLFYFTLFLAALTAMFDLGTLLYQFLGGAITARFLFKTITLLALVAVLFYFYLGELHRGWDSHKILYWLVGIIMLTLVTLSYGFYLIGSPASARKALQNPLILSINESCMRNPGDYRV